MIMPQAFRDSL